jgi:tetratricopeptide (TPR) repeat protein
MNLLQESTTKKMSGSLVIALLCSLQLWAQEGCISGDCNEGDGTFIYANGLKYSGQFKRGKRNGKGTITYTDGSIYRGDNVEDNRSGVGETSHADGAHYKGEYKIDKRQGQGVLTNSNGDLYEGRFLEGEYHGLGTLSYANGTVKRGYWTKGSLVQREGKYVAPANMENCEAMQALLKETANDFKAFRGERKLYPNTDITYKASTILVAPATEGYITDGSCYFQLYQGNDRQVADSLYASFKELIRTCLFSYNWPDIERTTTLISTGEDVGKIYSYSDIGPIAAYETCSSYSEIELDMLYLENTITLGLRFRYSHGEAECAVKETMRQARDFWFKGNDLMNIYKAHNHIEPEIAGKALKIFDQAIALYPEFADAHNSKGLAFYYLKKYDLAIDEFNSILKQDSSYDAAYNNLGMVYGELGQRDMEFKYYQLTIGKNKNNHQAYYNLGSFMDNERKYEEAIAYYNQSVLADSTYIFNYNNRGNSKTKAGMYEEAVADFDIAIRMNSRYKRAYNGRGLARSYLKRYKEAIADFKFAMSLEPESHDREIDRYSFNNMANCYYGLGDIENACENWKAAIASGYVYEAKWKKEYGIDDPLELIRLHCE